MGTGKRFLFISVTFLQTLALVATSIFLCLFVREIYGEYTTLKYEKLAATLAAILPLPTLFFMLMLAKFALLIGKTKEISQSLVRLLKLGEQSFYLQAALCLIIPLLLGILEDVGHIGIILFMLLSSTATLAFAMLFAAIRSTYLQKQN